MQSGEGRFRWWHARHGAADELAKAATERYEDVAWVVTREQVIDEHWFGPTIAAPIAARLGDVALVPVRPGQLLRPGRLRAVRADLPPRLADAGRGARAAARRVAADGEPATDAKDPADDRADPARPSRPSAASRRARRTAAASAEAAERREHGDAVTSPAKVMRIGSMVKMLLEEVRAAPLDEPSRERLAEIYERSVAELSDALSPDLQHELKMLALPFRDGEVPTEGEIRVAKAQLVGWLEGLFHGIQATLFAQQLAARQQLEQIRQLPRRSPPGRGRPRPAVLPPGTPRHVLIAAAGEPVRR